MVLMIQSSPQLLCFVQWGSAQRSPAYYKTVITTQNRPLK